MKFNVRDENGKEYKVEEVEEVKKTNDEDETKKPLTNTCTDDVLSPEEIASLKKLAGMADKLCALVDTTTNEEEEEEEIEDEGEQIEEVIDTDEPKKAKDSIKKSAGAIEKKTVKTEDSVEEDDVAAAWARRYGGNR
nr:MAG TPA: hypothetical protein [Caudoviricetes sp.]